MDAGDLTSKVGKRIVVTGMAGAGKSTFSKALAAKTKLPLIHLDLHIWNPGWVRVPESELLQVQHNLLSSDRWILDGNDLDDDLLVTRADTLFILTTPWWLCSLRALKRGLRRPPGTQLPEGCDESLRQRLGDEWGIAWRNMRHRKTIADRYAGLEARCSRIMQVHTLRSTADTARFLSML